MFGTIHQHLKQYLIQIFPLTIVVKEGKIHVEKIEKANISHSKRWFHFTNRSLRIPHYFVEILTPLQPWSKNYALIGTRYIP